MERTILLIALIVIFVFIALALPWPWEEDAAAPGRMIDVESVSLNY